MEKETILKAERGTGKTPLTSGLDDRLSEHVWSVISCVWRWTKEESGKKF